MEHVRNVCQLMERCDAHWRRFKKLQGNLRCWAHLKLSRFQRVFSIVGLKKGGSSIQANRKKVIFDVLPNYDPEIYEKEIVRLHSEIRRHGEVRCHDNGRYVIYWTPVVMATSIHLY